MVIEHPRRLIPQTISQPTRQALLQQMPTTIRSNTKAPKLSRDICCIAIFAFTGQRPTECYMIFRASALYTAYKLITANEYRYQHERAASAAELSPPLQALLQILDVVQPVTRWTADERADTVAFTPMDVDYNPIRLQSMPCALYLTHPESPSTTTRYFIRPPRLRSDLKRDAHWAPWWRTTILVHSPTSQPFPSMSAHNHNTTQGYLLHALTQVMKMANSHLSSLNITTPEYLKTSPTLLPTLDGAYIISHLRKDTSSQLTSFVISLAHP